MKFKEKAIFMVVALLCLNLSMLAQNISLKMSNVTVKKAMTELKEKSGYTFLYAKEDIDTNKKVNINATSLKEAISQILKGQKNVSYEIDGKNIVLKKRIANKNSNKNQKHKLIGTVIDELTNEPLIGVSISVKDSPNIGTITDVDGKYSIDVVDNSDLIFSYIGYKSQTLMVGDLGVMNVKMKSDNEVLSEVVVVGAGTQKKVSVTGSISSVKGLALKAPSSSLTNSLAGKLSGVISVVNSGQPGSTSQFYIRGISTFGGRTTPLILLDGVEISSGDLNNLPAESIENFSILKDASATAIYGARGANGVMLITTKSGSENTKATINVSFEQSFMKPVNILEFADGATYMETYNEAQLSRTPTAVPRYTQTQIDNTRNHVSEYVYPDVDWYDLMFNDYAMSQRANVNIQGGGSRVTYYMSLQANHDGGILDVPKEYSFDNNYNRYLYTFQNNIGYKLTSTTKIDLRMNAQIVSQKSPDASSDDIFRQVFQNNPVAFPAVFPEEEGTKHLRFGSAIMSAGRFYTNPYAYMLNTFRQQNENKLNISLNLNQKLDFIVKGLSLTSLVNFNNYSRKYYTRSLKPFLYGVDVYSLDENNPSQFTLMQLQKGEEYISQSGISRAGDNTFYFDSRLNYTQHFGNHNVTAMLMYMMREYSNDLLPNRNQGFSGRFTYDYANKYLAEFNFGYNGTERIAKDQRFEFFPAISLGWVISNENFWKKFEKYVDYFKIRGSYGLVGSDDTGMDAGAARFLYLNNVSMYGGMTFKSGYTGGTSYSGPIVNSYAVQNSHWERSKQFDIGTDIRLFDQVNITFDYYRNVRDRILMKRASFPAILGYAKAIPWSNVGKMENKGIELSVNWNKQINKDLNIDLRANYTYTKNKYIYVDEPDYPYVWQTNTGKPLNYMKGYVSCGLFKDEAEIQSSADQSLFGSVIMPGDIKYRDINGDGSITQEDQVMLSPYGSIPRIQYGLGFSMVYKNLDFSVFFNGSAKRRIMVNNGTQIYPFCANDTNDRGLMKWIADSHWSEGADNSNVVYPRLGILDTQISNNNQSSDFWMKNADFIRFKTLEIGYTYSFCRFYFSGDNLAVWSPFKYWDPELNSYTYPLQTTLNLGVQLKF